MEIGGGFMEGIFFFWLSWIGWVISTFFMKKDNKRLIISAALLIVIIGSPYEVTVLSYPINVSFLLLIVISYAVISQQTKKRTILYLFISSHILATANVAFHLFGMFDPVWIIFDRMWMLAGMMAYLTLLLIKNVWLRLATVCAGFGQGGLMYMLILDRYNFPIEVGSLSYFDVVAQTLMIITVWGLIENGATMLEAHMQRKQNKKAGLL
jgi:hypothetical protein